MLQWDHIVKQASNTQTHKQRNLQIVEVGPMCTRTDVPTPSMESEYEFCPQSLHDPEQRQNDASTSGYPTATLTKEELVLCQKMPQQPGTNWKRTLYTASRRTALAATSTASASR